VRRESPLQDEGRIAIPILTVAAGMTSLGTIIFWLRTASESESIQSGTLGLLFLTTLLSWVFIHMMFALHYAHEYCAEHRGQGGGTRFPGGGQPELLELHLFRLHHRRLDGGIRRGRDLAHHPQDRDGARRGRLRFQRDDDRADPVDRR
jgi:hypothetical protein